MSDFISKLRAGGVRTESIDPGQFPFDAFTFDDPNQDATPTLYLGSPWNLDIAAGTLDVGGAVTLDSTLDVTDDLTIGTTPTLFVDVSLGFVGIGTATPDSHLELSDAVSNGDYPVLKLTGHPDDNSTDYIGRIIFEKGPNPGDQAIIEARSNTGGSHNAELVFYTSLTQAGGPIERMRISRAGYVGVGMTSIYPLSVKSVANSSAPIIAYASGTSNPLAYFWENVSGDGHIVARDASNVIRVLMNTNGRSYFFGGDLAVGTNSATFRLDVRHSDNNDGSLLSTTQAGIQNSRMMHQNTGGTADKSAYGFTINTSYDGWIVQALDDDLAFVRNIAIFMHGGAMGLGGTVAPSIYADLTLEGGALCIKETTTPTADTNYGKVYTKTDNKLYFQSGDGVEHAVVDAVSGVVSLSGQLLVIDGDASTPAIAAVSDTDTGIWIASATIGMSIGGASEATISATALTMSLDLKITTGVMYVKEQAAASGDTPAYGQFWVKNDAPNVPMFTDDGGTDHQLAYV